MKFDFLGNDSCVAMSGEFTFTDHAVFLEIIGRLLGAQDQSIVIDLSGLDFIDSAGLGMLLIARDETGKAGRHLTLRAPKGQVQRMFAVTKFETLFAIET
jgi:HptB-dependent secretion and biofilm anti anti-sigma factor